jgi:hypothetical protein
LFEFEKALEDLQSALNLDPEFRLAHVNRSMLRLLLGQFEEGWPEYEWRLQSSSTLKKPHLLGKMRWLGTQSLQGKTILLTREQGFGDTLQFCRYVSLVKNLGARVVFEAPSALITLLDSLEGVDLLIEKGQPLPAFDFHCPLVSLPLAFKTQLNSIPNDGPYLKSSIDKSKYWSKKLGDKKKLRLGVVWSSSSNFKDDYKRSMSLEMFLNLIPFEKYEVVCLQKEIKDQDKNFFELHKNEIRFVGDELRDFSDTAALASSMDLVISTCTSVPHMTAALGIPTWILVSYSPDWRWLLNRDDSPWYDCIKLYRQGPDRQWSPLLVRIKEDLLKMLA